MLHTFVINEHEIRLYMDSPAVQRSGGLTDRLDRIEAALNLLPAQHIRLIVEPLIVVDRLPGGRERGGGWYAPPSEGGSGTSQSWLGDGNVRNTGVPAAEILERIGGTAGSGIIGITSFSFLRDANWGGGHKAYEFTILHEIGHSVDFHAGLTPSSSREEENGNGPYQGQRYPGGSLGELAAEAYSRFFLRPNSMCRGGGGTPPCLQPGGVRATGHCPNQRRCSARLQRDLQSTPAFRLATISYPLLGPTPADPAGAAEASAVAASSRVIRPTERPADHDCQFGVHSRAGWRLPGIHRYADL